MEVARKSTSYAVKLFLTIAIPICIVLIPTGEMFTSQIKLFLACTMFGILMFIFEQIDTTVAALFLTLSYIVFQVAPVSVVFKPWTTELTWTAVGCLIFISVAFDTNIFKRISYNIIAKIGTSYMGIIMSCGLMAIIIRVLMGCTGGCVPAALIAIGLCEACNLKQNKQAAGIIIATLVAVGNSDYFVYSPDYFALLAANMRAAIPSLDVNHFIIFKHNWMFLPCIFLFLFIVAKICGRNSAPIDRQIFIKMRDDLPPMDAREKKLLVAMLAILLYCFTIQFHHLSLIYAFLFIPLALFLPGINVGNTEHIKKTNYTFLFFFTGCQAIGVVGAYVGIAQYVSYFAAPYLVNMNAYVFTGAIWMFTFIMNFVMTPVAEMSAFALPIAQMCLDMNINPYPVMYAFFDGISNFVFPYESAFPLLFYSMGYIRLKDWMLLFGIKAVVDFLWLISVAFLWWHTIGLL